MMPKKPFSTNRTLTRQEYRWRKILLDKVKQFWLEGVLEKSLHKKVAMELCWEKWGNLIPISINEVKVFPTGNITTDIFNRTDSRNTMLILGESGSGKTVTLLTIAQSLIVSTQNDLNQPLPVVLNLSTWKNQETSIADWLVDKLSKMYGIPQWLGKTWVGNEQLFLLLDGLDEVDIKCRSNCVKALNQFLQEYTSTNMVVCCRIQDYQALSEHLKFKSAIYIQPLTLQQIDQYLEQGGEKLTLLKTVLNQNIEIKKLACSPLILSMLTLTYQGYSVNSLLDLGPANTFQQRLFDTYIKRMLIHQSTNHQYSQEKTKYWLMWIAQKMIQTSQTVFFMEEMKFSWLQTKPQRIWYIWESAIVTGLISGLSYGLSYGLIFGLVWGLIAGLTDDEIIVGLFWGLIHGLFWGLIAGLIAGLAAGLINRLSEESIDGLSEQPINGLSERPMSLLVIGLIPFFIVALMAEIVTDIVTHLRLIFLHFLLYLRGFIPWNYARFLDYATESLFLYKVGTGYIFVNRMLMEHFAQMELK